MQIDKSLVVPPDLPPITLSADIGFHLAPTLFLTTDLLLLSPPWTIGTLSSFILNEGVSLCYWFWVEACFRRNGLYVLVSPPVPLFPPTSILRQSVDVRMAELS